MSQEWEYVKIGKKFALPDTVFNSWVIVFQMDPIRVLNANRCLAHTAASNKYNFYFIGANGLILIGELLLSFFFFFFWYFVVPSQWCTRGWRLPHSQTLGPRNMQHNDLDLHDLKKESGKNESDGQESKGVGQQIYLSRSSADLHEYTFESQVLQWRTLESPVTAISCHNSGHLYSQSSFNPQDSIITASVTLFAFSNLLIVNLCQSLT